MYGYWFNKNSRIGTREKWKIHKQQNENRSIIGEIKDKWEEMSKGLKIVSTYNVSESERRDLKEKELKTVIGKKKEASFDASQE